METVEEEVGVELASQGLDLRFSGRHLQLQRATALGVAGLLGQVGVVGRGGQKVEKEADGEKNVGLIGEDLGGALEARETVCGPGPDPPRQEP